MLSLFSTRICFGIDNKHIRIWSIGNPKFISIQNIIITLKKTRIQLIFQFFIEEKSILFRTISLSKKMIINQSVLVYLHQELMIQRLQLIVNVLLVHRQLISVPSDDYRIVSVLHWWMVEVLL